MEKRVKIAVDAMGGDFAPGDIVRGAVEAARSLGVEIVLVGTSFQPIDLSVFEDEAGR
jgi:fatty acid/phospholipid biosynthesis enzyme